MSERIDVLAVMDAMAKYVNDQTEAHDEGATALLQRAGQARAAVAELIEKVEEARKFLTNEQWGTYHYMEGSDVYGDLRKHADALAAALARIGATP